MDIREDAYSNRSSLTAHKRYFGYPANAVLSLVVTAALLGVQLRSLLLFLLISAFGMFLLSRVCRHDPNGITVWLYVIRKRLLKRITCLRADKVADRPFIFNE